MDVDELQQKTVRTHTGLYKKRRAESLRVLRWLLVCFPHGLSLMWRRSCHWHTGLKAFVSGIYIVLALAVLLYPTPGKDKAGSVRIMGIEREIEVFGPELPAQLPDQAAYQYMHRASIVVKPDDIPETEIVYALQGTSYYHRYTCKYAYSTSARLTPYEASFLGFTPCKTCRPPEYNPNSSAGEAQ